MRRSRRILVTGGPGAGKTTVLQALAARGYVCKEDSARRIIQDRSRRSLSPRPEPVEFARRILALDVQQYLDAPDDGDIFFDRGIPDALCMLDAVGALAPGELERHLQEYPYEPKVFLFPPWEAIYQTDAERDHTFSHAVQVCEAVRGWYARIGFTVVEVAIGSVDERTDFLVRRLDAG